MVSSMGTGVVWSNPDRPIIHFGSPARPTTLVDEHGDPLAKR